MKKTLIMTAILGTFSASVQAQTNITVYGSIDAGVRRVNNANAAGDSNLTMATGTFNSNRLGFKGVEDLGGGLNAHFNLESGFNSATGGLDNTANRLFNRTANVGIGGAWGSLDFGRQYSVNFKTIGAYDPFNYKFTSLIPVATQGGLTRLDNDIQYTGTFGPVTARAEWALGETAGSTGLGARRAVGFTYAGGPLAVGAAYTRLTSTTNVDTNNWTLGGAYNFDTFRLAGGVARNDTDRGAKVDDIWLGGSYTISPAIQLTVAHYRTKADTVSSPRRGMTFFGGTYALSKRTNLYLDIDRSNFKGSGSPAAWGVQRVGTQSNVTGVSLGMNHFF